MLTITRYLYCYRSSRSPIYLGRHRHNHLLRHHVHFIRERAKKFGGNLPTCALQASIEAEDDQSHLERRTFLHLYNVAQLY